MRLGFLSTLLGGLLLFTACGDDNEEIIPTVPGEEYDAELSLSEDGIGDVRMATVTVDANTQSTITALVNFTSTNESMRRLYITQNIAGQGAEPYQIDANVDFKADGSIDIESANSNEIIYELELEVPSGVGAGDVVYELWTTTGRGDFRDQDKRLAVGVGEIILNYGGSNPAAEVNEFSATLLEAPLADGSSESFMSTYNGEVYRIDQGEEYAAFWDFGYFYGATNEASLASTNNYPSPIVDIEAISGVPREELNTMYFQLNNNVDFDAVSTSGDLASLTVSETDPQRITELAVGDVIAFVDSYGKKGLIRVADLVAGDGVTGEITIDVKVQP